MEEFTTTTSPTMKLRFINRNGRMILQQAHQDVRTLELFWLDVPFIEEVSND